MASDRTHRLDDLPPSAKLVYYVISTNGPMTQKAITAESLLPQRTVRYAINRLEDVDIVSEQVYLSDPRQQLYQVCEPDADAVARGTATADD